MRLQLFGLSVISPQTRTPTVGGGGGGGGVGGGGGGGGGWRGGRLIELP